MTKSPWLFAVISTLMLSACNFAPAANQQASKPTADGAQSKANTVSPDLSAIDQAFISHDDQAATDAEDKARPIMQAQVLLDRLGFAPGVIDDKMGQSTVNAIKGFQEANKLTVTGKLDEETSKAILAQKNLPATRVVTIPAEFLSQKFVEIPAKAEDKGKLDCLCYQTPMEALAERFHTTPDAILAMNPDLTAAGAISITVNPDPAAGTRAADAGAATKSAQPAKAADATKIQLAAGQKIRVPNIGGDAVTAVEGMDAKWKQTLADLGVATEPGKAAKVVVSKSKGILRALDENGKLIMQFSATMGSKHDPLPIGNWKVNGVAYNPTFNYNPELFWDVKNSEKKVKMPAGPNSPVGVVWIDLNKEHYGIHGTPSPETIGRAESHGCVRLTNWDVARLATMVKPGTEVVFEK